MSYRSRNKMLEEQAIKSKSIFSQWRQEARDYWESLSPHKNAVKLHIIANCDVVTLSRDISEMELVEEAVYMNRYLPLDKLHEFSVEYYKALTDRENERINYDK